MDTSTTDNGPHGQLPTVIATSVIRSANQGDSHGGVHLVDLERSEHRQVIDWDDAKIDWEGRGGDRGLRGIALWGEEVYLAASDEVFVYSPEFEQLRSFTNPYLKHCHEIDVAGDRLHLTSCGYDSILVYDLVDRRFVAGYTVRNPAIQATLDRLVRGATRGSVRRGPRLKPSYSQFDPTGIGGPAPADRSHINSVTVRDDAILLSGTELGRLYRIDGGQLTAHGRLPTGTHNARPWKDGLLYNDTAHDQVCHRPRLRGRANAIEVPNYPLEALENVDKAAGNARQGFGRGLTMWQDRYLITGSSPATISVYDMKQRQTITRINLSMDIRNAIHGLEVWPFADRPKREGLDGQ